jgi:hypothetical protein
LYSKSQYATVKHSRQLSEHTYTSDPHGLGTLTPTEFFQQAIYQPRRSNVFTVHRINSRAPLTVSDTNLAFQPQRSLQPNTHVRTRLISRPTVSSSSSSLAQLHEKSADNSLVSMELNYSLVTLLSDKYCFIVALLGNPNM